MIRRVVFLLASALVFLSGETTSVLAAGGQTGDLQGTVLVAATRAALEGAAVTAVSPSGTFTARTNARGFFSILGMNVDTYVVSVESPGYDALSLTGVTITGDQTSDLGTLTVSKKLKTTGADHGFVHGFRIARHAVHRQDGNHE